MSSSNAGGNAVAETPTLAAAPISVNGTNATTPASGASAAAAATLHSNRKGVQKKQRILWDSDAATRDGKTSIGILLEWLTTPGNYDRWKDGKSQFGETREALCSQIKAEMKKHGILHRENANIRTQISELERSFDTAVTWLTQNGYDGKLPDAKIVLQVGDLRHLAGEGEDGDRHVNVGTSEESAAVGAAGNSVEAYVLRTCRYFHVLDTIMRQPASAPTALAARTRPRRSYTRTLKKKAAELGEEHAQHDSEGSGENESSCEHPPENPSEPAQQQPAAATELDPNSNTASRNDATASPAMVALANRAAERRQPPTASQKRKAASENSSASVGGVLASAPDAGTSHGGSSNAPPPALLEPWQSAVTNLANYENTQRLILEAAREERERKRFHMEEEKYKLECEKLRYEVQATKLKLNVERTLARKQLVDAGLSQAEVESMING